MQKDQEIPRHYISYPCVLQKKLLDTNIDVKVTSVSSDTLNVSLKESIVNSVESVKDYDNVSIENEAQEALTLEKASTSGNLPWSAHLGRHAVWNCAAVHCLVPSLKEGSNLSVTLWLSVTGPSGACNVDSGFYKRQRKCGAWSDSKDDELAGNISLGFPRVLDFLESF